MKHILQVLKFEYFSCIKSKAFILTTILLIATILFMTFVPAIISAVISGSEQSSEEGKQPVIAIVNHAYESDETVREAFTAAYQKDEIRISQEDLESLKSKVKDGTYEFAILMETPLTYTYITKNNSLMSATDQTVNELMTTIYRMTSMTELGIDQEQAAQLLTTRPAATTITTDVDQTKNYFSTYILVMLQYIAIVMYGQMVSQSVVSEKNTRAMEMLISCAKPSHLMFGKVIGSGLGGITQMILILSVSLLSFHTINMDNAFTRQILEYVNFSLDTVLYAILFFILGYFIYSFLLGALSSLASRSEDLNTLITPVMMLYVAAFIVVLMCMNSDQINGPVMIVCSYIPFTAPIAMFVRIVMSDVSVIEVIISVCVQLFSIYLFGMLAAAIYRIGVLLYGKTPKPSELVKLLKEQHKNRQALKKRQS